MTCEIKSTQENIQAQSECNSVFCYSDEEAESEPFSLSKLEIATSEYFQAPCKLSKLAQGGFHKVYDVLSLDPKAAGVVVRVASPAFPKEKMESEVATLKYLKQFTSVPVPTVMHWDSDASNPVGAEYMIMEKMDGTSPFDDWKSLPVEVKEKVVKQVAKHLLEIFAARFDKAGSLYCSESTSNFADAPEFHVGPIVSDAFYTSLDGTKLYPEAPPAMKSELQKLRGPFTRTGDLMRSTAHVRILEASHLRAHALNKFEVDCTEAEAKLNKAQEILKKAIHLTAKYPGERQLHEPSATPGKPFSFCLCDFRTTNILIDQETGDVKSLIDFESTTIAPLWACATVPYWIPDPKSDMRDWYGGSLEDQTRLWDAFHTMVAEVDVSGEWRRAYQNGEAYRQFLRLLQLGLPAWSRHESFVDELTAWVQEHPGMPMPDEEI